MIQNYTTLKANIQKINEILSKSGPGQIQKIFSAFNYICLNVRLKGSSIYILIGRGADFQGVWLVDKNIPSESRIRDRFLEYLRKKLKGRKVSNIYLHEREKIVGLDWVSSDFNGEFYFRFKGKEMSFVDVYPDEKQNRIAFNSILNSKSYLDSKIEREDLIKNIFNNISQKDINEENVIEFDFVKEVIEAKERVSHKKERKKEKFFRRKEKNINNDLLKVKKWKLLKEVLEQPGFELPKDYKFSLEGIKFKIDVNWNEFKRRDIVYKKIKAFKKAEDLLEKRLLENKLELKKWLNRDQLSEVDTKKIVSPLWPLSKVKKSTNTQVSSTSGEYQIFDYYGMELGVGKSTTGNDFLRSSWAKKLDLWFHLDGHKSSHAILKLRDDYTLTIEDYSIIASIIRDMGSLTILEIPLIFTQVKNLKGIKGQKGAVIYKKEKHLTVQYKENWREIIA